MLMGNNKLKTYVASGAIQPRRFIKFGANDSLAVQSGATDAGATIGVSDSLGAADTHRVEAYVQDFADVEFGGTVARGAFVKPDAQGRAVAAGAGESYCGKAWASAVSGDITSIKIERGVVPA